MQDAGELAARLGSIDTFDRRGNVLFLTSFENGIASWKTSVLGTGASIVHSTSRARNGAYSVKMTAGSDAIQPTLFWVTLPYPALSKFGVEVSFALGSDINDIFFEFQLYDGTNLHDVSLELVVSTSTLYYKDSAGAYQPILTGLGLEANDYLFHTLKLAVDWPNEGYWYVILDSHEAGMSGIAYRKVADAGVSVLVFQIDLYSVATKNGYIYVDDVIITQNEP
jgi:hypothetical protein